MKKKLLLLSIILLFTACYTQQVSAQPGSIDPSFGGLSGESNCEVYTSVVQTDGKIIIGGCFTHYDNTNISGLARLNANGTIDNTFNVGTGVISPKVYSCILQPDGKIIICGLFGFYNGTARNCIARLYSNGTIDNTFNPGTGTDTTIFSVTLQPDGKIIIGGSFTSYDGTPRSHIARLNANGSLDLSFDPGTGAVGGIYTRIYGTAIQADGKIIIGGIFISYNSITVRNLTRLNTNGTLDTTFSYGPGLGPDNNVHAVTLQPDGKILIGGTFLNYSGALVKNFARLNSDGTLDPGFNTGTGITPQGNPVRTITLQYDGKIIVGGDFYYYNAIPRSGIARANTDGTLDTSFDPGTGVTINGSPSVFVAALQSDGKIIVGGGFNQYNGTWMGNLARLNGDSCGSHFIVYPDVAPHNWIAVNQAFGAPPLTYSWNWGDGNFSGGANPSHTYNNPGFYNICLSITDAGGCVSSYCDSSTYLYRASSNATMVTINVIVPNGINETLPEVGSFVINPNPTKDNFKIIFNHEIENGSLFIYNSFGKKIVEESIFNESKKEINLKNSSSGIYFVKVYDGEKQYGRKIILAKD